MDLQDEIDELTRRFVSAFNRGDAAEAASYYTSDAIYANPGPVVAFGREAIRVAFEQEFRSGARITFFETLRCEGDGSSAWALQRFPTNTGETVLMIALRREEGRWLIASETVTA
ncbi:YybH family protein [Chthonobacter rhizosphaerae]|uniref:YybH family protein n=1 Tax=Chthonobacter rhizosphaerae TaxID=2735553 RepID=UPI0015EF2B0E|nr:nuclear transport factor 2 family protein [Chthonobacter rhizosphaerae]